MMIQRCSWMSVALFAAACAAQQTPSDTARATIKESSVTAGPVTAAGVGPSVIALRHSVAGAPDSLRLDSCAGLDRGARPQNRVRQPGEIDPSPREGSWTDTRVQATPRFTMEVPRATSVTRQLADSVFTIDAFPSCRYSCSLQVTFHRDKIASSAGAYVDRLRMAAFSGDAEDSAWAPGPSRILTADGEPAVLVETPCGDCTSASLFAVRGDTAVELQYFVDDREGYQPGIACRLARVAQTFQWAAPPPNDR